MQKNPFNITKSVDLTDDEIATYWVDFSGDKGFVEMMNPGSQMPMLVLGSKGSGKTHIMRYMSFSLQKIRHGEDLATKLKDDGYIGLYMLCSGLNSGRFRGKGQSEDTWDAVFTFHFELWLAQIVLKTVFTVMESMEILDEFDEVICERVVELFDIRPNPVPKKLSDLLQILQKTQRGVDVAVNNSAITQNLSVEITLTSGRLLFGIPKVMAELVPYFNNIQFLYLIDEFENLTESQQRHVNTLIRERESPSSFRVGARLYGIRTYQTSSAEEENKEGSEFETLILDHRLRKDKKAYNQFANRLIIDRLNKHGFASAASGVSEDLNDVLAQAFEEFDTSRLMDFVSELVNKKYSATKRPYFLKLRDALTKGLKLAPGISSKSDVDELISALSFPESAILEKTNTFILYQGWKSGCDLKEAATEIHDACRTFAEEYDLKSNYGQKFQHFRSDLLAQLLRDCIQNQQKVYTGSESLIEMSWGMPRNLLVLFKKIYSWSAFKDEEPFAGKPISIAAQVEGIVEAANWFYENARAKGKDGKIAQDSVERLCTLFREIRYSPKPSECELTTFSYNPRTISDDAKNIIDIAVKWSLLVDIGKQNDRNSERVDRKLQINRMLAPRWGLSLSSRGALALSANEVDVIFGDCSSGIFNELVKERIARMTPPLFGKKEKLKNKPQTTSLFDGGGLDD